MAATVASVVRASTRPGAPSVAERVQAVPRLVRSTLDGTYAGTTLKRLGLVAGAVAYVASPIDLLPEAVLPIVGAADDAVVISWALKAFFDETDRFLAWEVGQGLRRFRSAGGRRSRTGGAPDQAARTTVPGEPVSASDASPTAASGAGAGAEAAADGVLRRDRDATGAAAPGRLIDHVTRITGTGTGRDDRARLPEGVRQAATDYVLESVRKRLER